MDGVETLNDKIASQAALVKGLKADGKTNQDEEVKAAVTILKALKAELEEGEIRTETTREAILGDGGGEEKKKKRRKRKEEEEEEGKRKAAAAAASSRLVLLRRKLEQCALRKWRS